MRLGHHTESGDGCVRATTPDAELEASIRSSACVPLRCGRARNHHACIHSRTCIKSRLKHGSIMNRFAMASAPVPWTRRVQDPKPAATSSRPETRPIAPSLTPSIPSAGCRGKGLLAIPKADCGSVLASIGITLPSKATGKGKAVLSPPIRPLLPRGPVHSSAASSSASVGVALTTGPVKRGAMLDHISQSNQNPNDQTRHRYITLHVEARGKHWRLPRTLMK